MEIFTKTSMFGAQNKANVAGLKARVMGTKETDNEVFASLNLKLREGIDGS